jgi:uncharacterized protein (TIGR03382 family)
MTQGRLDDVATGAIGAAAGTVMDPLQGMRRLTGKAATPGLIAVAIALVVGYLLGRRRRR